MTNLSIDVTRLLVQLQHQLQQLIDARATGGGGWSPVQHAPQQVPVQTSPVQQTPLQTAAPMKATGGGSTMSTVLPPVPVIWTQPVGPKPKPKPAPVLTPTPVEEPQRKRRRRSSGGGGGGGGQVSKPKPPTSTIRAQQNINGHVVNRESRSMPADYKGSVTVDHGHADRKTKNSPSNRNKPKSKVGNGRN